MACHDKETRKCLDATNKRAWKNLDIPFQLEFKLPSSRIYGCKKHGKRSSTLENFDLPY